MKEECKTQKECTAEEKCEISKNKIKKMRYLVWLPMALAYMVGFFHRNAGALVGEYLKIDFAITSATGLGFLTSIYFYTSAIMQIPSGIIADKFNPKKVLLTAMALIVGGTILSCLAKSLPLLYVGRLILSLGSAMIYINLFKIVTNWWKTSETGTISAFTSFLGNLGPLIATVPLAALINSIGWRGSYLAMASIVVFAMILCAVLTKTTPADAGLMNWDEIDAVESGQEIVKEETKKSTKVTESLKQIFSNKQSWFPAVACAGMYGSFIAFFGIWAVPYCVQVYGMTKMEAASILFVGQLTYLIAGPLNGILSDKLRLRKRLFSGYILVGVIGWLLLLFWNGGKPPIWGLYLIVILLNIGSSPVYMGLAYAREVNPPKFAGTAAGVVNVGSYIGAGILQPLVGYVLESSPGALLVNGVQVYSLGAFQSGFICCAVAMAIAFVATLFMKETHCKNIYHELIAKK